MPLEHDKKSRRWKVICDAPDCPCEYSCSAGFVNHDGSFIKKELLSMGWTIVPTDGKVPKFVCYHHKL